MNVEDELKQIETDIQKLQARAEMLRRIRETPHNELIADFIVRFRQTHKSLLDTLDAFSAETQRLFFDLAVVLGYSESVPYKEWVVARGEVGVLFRDAQRASADFSSDTRTALLLEARKELETLFLRLQGRHPVSLWFGGLLVSEGVSQDQDASDTWPNNA